MDIDGYLLCFLGVMTGLFLFFFRFSSQIPVRFHRLAVLASSFLSGSARRFAAKAGVDVLPGFACDVLFGWPFLRGFKGMLFERLSVLNLQKHGTFVTPGS